MATKKYVDESGLSYFTQQLDVKYIDNDELEIAVNVIENELNSLDENKVGFDDYATSSEAGVVKTSDSINMNSNHQIGIVPATDNNIKEGINQNNPITPNKQDQAAFYGLAKAAGDTTQSQSSNAVGIYTDEAKAAIQTMLDIPSTDDIPEVPVQDVQIDGTSVLGQDGTANIPLALWPNPGIVKVSPDYGIGRTTNGAIRIATPSDALIKEGTNQYRPIVPLIQDKSTFYGLAKASGDTTQSQSSNAVGIYTDEAKGFIQHMLGIDNLAPYESDITADQAYAVGELFMLHGKLHRATTAINALDVFTVGTNCEVVNASDVFARDVQIDGTSIMSNGVANVPMAALSTFGTVRVNTGLGIGIVTSGTHYGRLFIDKATSSGIKSALEEYRPITPIRQHESTFYGLAKASGDTTQASSSNAVGVYTDNAKIAIRTMLGSLGSTDYASSSTGGVVKVTGNDGIIIDANGVISSNVASSSQIKNGSNSRASITTNRQHESVFYGLAKASGDTTQSQSDNAVGIYTDNAKSSIKSMLSIMESGIEATDPNTDGNLRINTTANLSDDYVKKTDYATNDTGGVIMLDSIGTYGVKYKGADDKILVINPATTAQLKSASGNYRPLVPSSQHIATFYGLAKAAGDTSQSASSNAVGTYTDAAKDAIQQMLGVTDIIAGHENILATTVHSVGDIFMMDGKLYEATSAIAIDDAITVGTNCRAITINEVFVKKTNYANASIAGAVKVYNNQYTGIGINHGTIYISKAEDSQIKSGLNENKPIVPSNQHLSVFYGLAKASGDTTQVSSDNAVGTYTESAKSAIRSMLGMSSSIIGPYEETVSGSTPTITGQPNYRYLCGEVTSINITPPASGTIDVIFTSGSTVAVMTVPNTVKFPQWFDASTLEANTIYEIVITNGTYGGVMTWQV